MLLRRAYHPPHLTHHLLAERHELSWLLMPMGMMSPRKRTQRFHVTTLLRFCNCDDVWLCVLGAARWFRASGPGVSRVIHLRQVLPVQVGIDLGGGDVGVAKHLLDRPEIT